MAHVESKSTFDTGQIAAIAAAATTLISTVSALAVGGALQQMQRNHGVFLVLAVSLAMGAVAAVVVFTLTKPPDTATEPSAAIWRRVCRYGAPVSVFVFLAGFVLGIWGMVITQQGRERPSLTASLSGKAVLTGTATAHNLGTEGRMVTQVIGFRRVAGSTDFAQDVRYFAITGPDSDGTVTETFSTVIPRRKYVFVVASASTGNESGCNLQEATSRQEVNSGNYQKIAQANLPGCAVFYPPFVP